MFGLYMYDHITVRGVATSFMLATTCHRGCWWRRREESAVFIHYIQYIKSVILSFLACTAKEGPVRSNINVWFRFMYSQKWNRIKIFCLQISTFMLYLWAVFIFPVLTCLFFCSQTGRPILVIYKSLFPIHECVIGKQTAQFLFWK